jgi:excisionase family DNA binding protein
MSLPDSNPSKRPSGETGNRPGTDQSAAASGNAFGPVSPGGLADQNPGKRRTGVAPGEKERAGFPAPLIPGGERSEYTPTGLADSNPSKRPDDEKDAGYLKASEVAERLSLNITTVYGMCADGVLPSIRVGEKAVRIPEAAFEAYLVGRRE